MSHFLILKNQWNIVVVLVLTKIHNRKTLDIKQTLTFKLLKKL